jgi:hypothetical protein
LTDYPLPEVRKWVCANQKQALPTPDYSCK